MKNYLVWGWGKLKNLNGWHRLGIVLTFSWLLFVTIKYDAVLYYEYMNGKIVVDPTTIWAVLILIAGWLGAYFLLWVFRWVKRGFEIEKDRAGEPIKLTKGTQYLIIGLVLLLVFLWWTRWEYHTLNIKDESQSDPPCMIRTNRLTGKMEIYIMGGAPSIIHVDKEGNPIEGD